MKDRFGSIMVENLKHRGCTLAGIEHCTSLDTQQQRFLDSGWTDACAVDMNCVYAHLPASEVQR